MAAPKKEIDLGPDVGVTIRGMDVGDGVKYACSGIHIDVEDAQYTEGKRKFLPGDVFYLPEKIAEKYLANRKLERA